MTTCDACGEELRIGDYPFCPHGRGTGVVVGDDIPGGQWFENGLTRPEKFYSHSAHRKAVQKNGCEITPYWVPNDKHLTRWDTVNLDAARELVSRGSRRPETSLPPIDARVEWEDAGRR